jgi:hypothetical protein
MEFLGHVQFLHQIGLSSYNITLSQAKQKLEFNKNCCFVYGGCFPKHILKRGNNARNYIQHWVPKIPCPMVSFVIK